MSEERKREARVALSTMGRSPFAAALAATAFAENMRPSPKAVRAIMEVEARIRRERESAPPPAEPAPAPEPPKTQRLRVIDEAGIAYLNNAKAKRLARNAKRLRDFARQQR